MKFIVKNIKWVMLVSGALTFTMFYGVFAPQAALESMFGASFDGALESILIRSWSALVGLMGAMLIYGAFSDRNRVFAISIASISKLVFVSLILIYGQKYWGALAPAIAMDCVVIVLAVIFLIAVRMERSAL